MLSPVVADLVLLATGVPAQDSPPLSPDPDALGARLQGRLEELVSERGLPGASAALVLPDGRVVEAAAGLASREEGREMTTDDLLLSGSVGKSYVSATALGLVLEGRLRLDAPVAPFFEDADWYDRLPGEGAFTVEQLLRHETGMERYELTPQFWEAAMGEPDRVWRPEELLAFVFDTEASFAPGEGFLYADTNYILLGMVLEKVLEGSITKHIRARFLEPNELSRTRPSSSRRIEGLVQGYAVLTRAFGVPERVLDGSGTFVFNPQFEWCGGGYASAPGDLARWSWLFYGGRLFEEEYLDHLLRSRPAAELGGNRAYGLGVIVSDTRLGPLHGHDGFMAGFLATTGYFPDLGVAGALQINTDDMRALGAPLQALLVELAELVGG